MEAVQYIRLSQLTRDVQATIKEAFASRLFWVIADVSEHSYYPANHRHYFELVEKEEDTDGIVAKIKCVAWRNGSARIKAFEESTGQRFKAGINALMEVAVSYHPLYGLQLTLHDIDPAFTIGMLEQQKQATIQKLLAEYPQFISKQDGVFITNNNQLKLRAVIQKIAVISSSSSAGLQDFIHTLQTNGFSYTFAIDYYYTVVQGEANAELVYERFLDVFYSKIDYDAVVLIRGGGAQTDLLIFDQFQLGKVVAKFPIPVITGIGHHKNETIVDLMAHSPTKTPTKAAEFIVAHNRQFEEGILDAQKNIVIRAQQVLAHHAQRLAALSMQLMEHARSTVSSQGDRLVLTQQQIRHRTEIRLHASQAALHALSCKISSQPATALARRSFALNCTAGHVGLLIKMYFAKRKAQLEQYDAMCRLMNPQNILKKGFAILYYHNRAMPAGSGIPLGAHVRIQLHDGELAATVTAKNNADGNADL